MRLLSFCLMMSMQYYCFGQSGPHLKKVCCDNRGFFLRRAHEELTTGTLDISLNKLNLVHSLYPQITGDHIFASVKEQRFDSTDIDLHGRYFNSGIEAQTQSTHASIIATMIGGAGNSSSFSLGAARGVHLCSSDFSNLFPDGDLFYQGFHISVQNHSYGTGIENFYGADASAYDSSVFNRPSLVHVFSSGNSGSDTPADGQYAGIAGFSNLTGSFKMAKNIITVGSVDSFGNVAVLSSRGPAYDGRVKPEIVAFGDEGSSGAAALVSGAAVLLQEAYWQQHGHLPSSALIRSVLVNSADQIGSSPVSYVYGYGSMNAYRALACVESGHFLEDTVQRASIVSIPVVVPQNIAVLKITVAWTDQPAQPNTAKALINDVDTKLTLPSGNVSWEPWVLNTAASSDSLLQPAARKKDTLNNIEQITVDHPAAGNYVLQVSGEKLVAAQPFAMSFLLDTAENFTWTYPAADDVLQSAHEHVLRWQTNIQQTGTVQYALQNGGWQTIGESVRLSDGFLRWDLPDTVSVARVRMILAGGRIEQSGPFPISKIPDLQVVFNCQDSFMLQWNDVGGKTYRVFQLGSRYLEPIDRTSGSFIILKKQSHPSLHYAVAPIEDSAIGLRSNTIDYTKQGTGCYFQTFYATLENQHISLLELNLGGVFGLRAIAFQKKQGGGFNNIYSTVGPLFVYTSFADSQLVKGVNTYRAALVLQNGSTIYSAEQSDFYFPTDPVIIFPNPVSQYQRIRIIASEPGSFSVAIFDALGKNVYSGVLTDIDQQAGPLLSRGVYFVRIFRPGGSSFTKKLIVY